MAPRPETRLGGCWRQFATARGGNVAMLFGLLCVPMLMLTGAAIDYGFATRLETKLQAATDATALLLCKTSLSTSSTDLNTLAQTTMNGAMGATGLVVDPLVITSNPRQITLGAHKLSTVFFGAFTKTTIINPGASARCATPIPKTFEIALVLDNTGSMSNAGDDGVTKLSALQTAARNFISYVFTNPAFASGTKVSIVPFSAAVAVNPSTYRYASWVDTQAKSAYHWINVSGAASAGFTSRFDIFTKLQATYSRWGWAGCFESLPYPQNVTDTGVTSNNNTLYIPYFAPDEAGAGGAANWNGNVSFNSYIDDDDGTSSGSCQIQSPSPMYATAQARACKYSAPHGAAQVTFLSELGPNGPNFGCTTLPLQTLTTSTSTLNSIIGNMAAGGTTNIHEGLMWGWRTISPNSVLNAGTAAAASYSDTTVNKIIILMTDGMNTWIDNPYTPNKSLFSSNGYFFNADGSIPDFHFPPANRNIANGAQGRAGLDALTRLACTNVGTAGTGKVVIYTIGFSVSSDPIDALGIQLLKDCATSGHGQYIQANDSNSLIAAFAQIAASIGTLRLTQ